ncbi:MAG: phenylalanine--tRNA ligase subunit beta [Eubacteriales bacterium]
MLTPYNWLMDYIDGDISVEELKEKMISSGNAIENITDLGGDITNVVVGQIKEIKKHPDADKLLICSVDTKDMKHQIVTGADNVFEGAKVPVALHGAHLPSGMKIKKGKLRGELSEGMLCSGEELNLTEEDYPGASKHGILILKDDAQTGEDIKKTLGLDDVAFEFEVGANRPDCLSILGLAKEAAAATGTKMKMPDLSYKESGRGISDYISVQVKDHELCTRYISRVVKNVKIEPSPSWMQKRLLSAGVRPINNIVDITNFVMLETGQPMHAFDLNDIGGNKIIVRCAVKGEKMVTLDDKEREFNDKMLLICDAKKPIGIAGIMGGLNSEIKPDTKTVIFESAKFAHANIRQTSRTLGLSTESSMRFSKGVSAYNSAVAMKRALNLVCALNAGEIVSGKIDILSEDVSDKEINITADKINAILGSKIAIEDMAKILNRLDLKTAIDKGTLNIKVPSVRADIERDVDIAEEIARIYGYDNIESIALKEDVRRGKMPQNTMLKDEIKKALSANGFYECVTYSFGSPATQQKILGGDYKKHEIRLLNPLGEDKSVMRQTGIADMMTVISTNIKHKVENLRLFEIGKVYLANKKPLKELPDEKDYICIGMTDVDFYDLKGVVENISDMVGAKELTFKAGAGEYFHQGRSAKIYIKDDYIGEIGEIAAATAEKFDVEERVYVAQIELKQLFEHYSNVKKYVSLPKFPESFRDLAFVVNTDIEAAKLSDVIVKNGGKFLTQVKLFDVFTGKSIGEDKKSLAFSLTFRSNEKTLKDEDVNKFIEKIISAAQRDLGAYIRK